MQKFDPYINIDPGTMNPIQHGEVFVTDDGAETDLDLGHYERFIDESLTKNSNVTTGKVYWSVLQKERRGDYGGGTVQVIPHITNEIKSRFYRNFTSDETHIAIIEVGGTVGASLLDKPGEELTVLFDAKGVSLIGYGLSYQGDFEGMLHRVSDGRLAHEMLVRAAKTTQTNVKGIDATAGMGEDAFLLAACGYEMTLYEQNPVVAVLLKDALRRAKKHPKLKDIAARMQLVEGNSLNELKSRVDDIDLIYLDPMFPGRQKSGLINKKLQLIQKLEPPCSDEVELFEAAIQAKPSKIIVKRPLKSPFLAGKNPTYELKGKAIRYDCYAL